MHCIKLVLYCDRYSLTRTRFTDSLPCSVIVKVTNTVPLQLWRMFIEKGNCVRMFDFQQNDNSKWTRDW